MVLLPQGKEERSTWVLTMGKQIDSEHFGHCSDTEACKAECPQGISVLNIARMDYEYSKALFVRKK